MEIETFLIASSVEMVIAQRLVRDYAWNAPNLQKCLNLNCLPLSLLEVSSDELAHLGSVKKAVGCPNCQNLGYRGRVGIFELMRMSDSIHGLVKSASAPDIREVALREGMSTLQGSGWEQIKRGLTTIDEVVRYADGMLEESL